MELLKKHILQLENDLLKPGIRQSVEKTSELLAEGFLNFVVQDIYIDIIKMKQLMKILIHEK